MADISWFLEDYERVEGVPFPEGKGVLMLDIAAHYPAPDQKSVVFRVGLSDHQPIEKAEDIELPGIVLNHRYPNTDYITVSKKKGRRVSKVGYCIVDDIEKINQYKYLYIEYSKPHSYTYRLTIPVNINLSTENPAATLEIYVMLDRAFMRIVSEPDITITVYDTPGKDERGEYRHHCTQYFVESWGGVFRDLKANGKDIFCLEWEEITDSHTEFCNILYRTQVDIPGMPLEAAQVPMYL